MDADLQHERIWEALAADRAAYRDAIEAGDLAVDLNPESLCAYLEASATVAELTQIARAAGMQEDPEWYADRTHVEQAVLWLLRRTGIDTLASLDELLAGVVDRAPRIFEDIAQISNDRGFLPWALPDSIVEWLVLVLRRADPQTVYLSRFADEIEAALNTLIGNPVPQAEQ